MEKENVVQLISKDCGDVPFGDIFIEDLFLTKQGQLCKKLGHDGSYIECHPSGKNKYTEDKEIKYLDRKTIVII